MLVSAVLARMRRLVFASFTVASLWLTQSQLRADSVTFAWDASTDPSVVSYNLYYGTASGSYSTSVSAGSATSATLTALAQGTTYFFAATAVNSSGLESPFS